MASSYSRQPGCEGPRYWALALAILASSQKNRCIHAKKARGALTVGLAFSEVATPFAPPPVEASPGVGAELLVISLFPSFIVGSLKKFTVGVQTQESPLEPAPATALDSVRASTQKINRFLRGAGKAANAGTYGLLVIGGPNRTMPLGGGPVGSESLGYGQIIALGAKESAPRAQYTGRR